MASTLYPILVAAQLLTVSLWSQSPILGYYLLLSTRQGFCSTSPRQPLSLQTLHSRPYTNFMRLILQPKSTKKQATPYTLLLNKVTRLRFFVLHRVFLVLSVIFAVFSFRLSLAVFTALALAARARKIAAHTTPISGPTPASELRNRLWSPRFAASTAVYALSAFIYFVLVACPKGDLYSVELVAGIPVQAKGLSKAFRDGVISHSLVYLNENKVYNLALGFCLAVAYATYIAVTDKALFVVSKTLVSPREALFSSDVKPFLLHSLHICSPLLAFPLIYILLRSIFLLPFYAVPLRGYVVASTARVSFWGALFVYPLKWSFLVLLWQLSNRAFAAYVQRGPVHDKKTVSEGSPTPNATLLSGITHERYTLTRLEAWLELAVISGSYKDRRVSIYTESSEKPLWTQIYDAFDSYISGATADLKELVAKPVAPEPEKKSTKPQKLNKRKITVSDKQVLFNQNSALDQFVARLQNQAEGFEIWGPLIDRLLDRYEKFTDRVLASKYGVALSPTSLRKVHEVLPDADVLEHAITAISQLIVHSYEEDTMGYVQVDISKVLDRYDALFNVISLVKKELGVNISSLEQALEDAFTSVCGKFGDYFDDLKVSESVRKRASLLQ